jgi:hypothetical protein
MAAACWRQLRSSFDNFGQRHGRVPSFLQSPVSFTSSHDDFVKAIVQTHETKAITLKGLGLEQPETQQGLSGRVVGGLCLVLGNESCFSSGRDKSRSLKARAQKRTGVPHSEGISTCEGSACWYQAAGFLLLLGSSTMLQLTSAA